MRGNLIFLALAAAGLFLAGCECMKSKGAGASFNPAGAGEQELVARYGVLADELLRAEKEEYEINRTLLGIYKGQADAALTAAAAAQGKDQAAPLEKAVLAVTSLAQEGNDQVTAIKTRLKKGGHHYTKAEGTADEYIFVEPKAKQSLMNDVKRLREMLAGAQGGTTAPAAEMDAIKVNVDALAEAAMSVKK